MDSEADRRARPAFGLTPAPELSQPIRRPRWRVATAEDVARICQLVTPEPPAAAAAPTQPNRAARRRMAAVARRVRPA